MKSLKCTIYKSMKNLEKRNLNVRLSFSDASVNNSWWFSWLHIQSGYRLSLYFPKSDLTTISILYALLLHGLCTFHQETFIFYPTECKCALWFLWLSECRKSNVCQFQMQSLAGLAAVVHKTKPKPNETPDVALPFHSPSVTPSTAGINFQPLDWLSTKLAVLDV